MKPLSKEDFQELVRRQEDPSVSIYLPLQRGGADAKQNQIRLKNAIREATDRLEEVGLRACEAEELLEPASQLLHDSPFWKNDADGLALFLADDFSRYYRVPTDFPERVVVSSWFHIKPLIPLVSNDGKFYVLALSKKQVRLLQCTHYSQREVPLPNNTPTSIDDELEGEVREKHLQHHTGSPDQGRAGIIHGQGDSPDKAAEKRKTVLFVKHVRKGVQKLLGGSNAPLVLAGLGELRSMYHDANGYAGLLDECIDDEPTKYSNSELREKAWELVQPGFEQTKREAIGTYERLADTDRASDDVEEIVGKAYQGVVQSLLIDLDHQVWGTFDPQTGEVNSHDKEESGDEDLVDLAAIYTLMHGGRTHALGADEMPEGIRMGAIYRY